MIIKRTIIDDFKAHRWLSITLAFAITACSSSPPLKPRAAHTNPNQQVAQIQGQSIAVEVNGQASTRDEARQLVLNEGVREGLNKFLGDTTGDNLFNSIRKWTVKLKANNYKPLVRRWLIDIDQESEGQHYLQGKLILDYNSLQNFSKQYLAKEHRFFGRFSYLITLDTSIARSREELTLSKRLTSALEQRFITMGFKIKRLNQQKQAQYLLKIGEVLKEDRGLNRSLIGTIQTLDNRTGRTLFSTADEYATASIALYPTESVLEKELMKRLTEKVSAEISRTIITEQSTDIIFLAPHGINRSQVRDALEQGLAKAYNVTGNQNINDFINGVNFQMTEEDDQTYTLSFLVPQRIDSSRKRQFERDLVKLQGQVLHAQSPSMEAGQAGQQIVLFDRDNPPAILQYRPVIPAVIAHAEQLIRDGKLDQPAGSGHNAFDTLQNHLREFPNDEDAKRLIQRISQIFVSQAEEALDKNQKSQAERYLKRARRVWPDNPDIAKVKAPPPTPIVSQQTSTKPTSKKPQLVFPELEKKLRGVQVAPDKENYLTGVAADIDGIDSITINNQDVKFASADSKYHPYINLPGAEIIQFKVPLNEGSILVTVNDTEGHSVSREVTVKNHIASVAPTQDNKTGARILENGNYWALLIANQNYTEGLPQLDTPFHDVEHLKKILIEKYSFKPKQVYVVTDATRKHMEVALDKMHDRVKGTDSLLIYYAGHGFQDKNYGHNGGKGFWIPVDGKSPEGRSPDGTTSDSSYRTTYLPNSQVHDIVQASRAKHVLLISDSCYSGTFKSRSLRQANNYAANMDYFYGLAAKKSRRAITSGDLQPVADGGPDGHSIFAYHLIEILKKGDRLLSAEQLFNSLHNKVATAAPQVPQYFTIQGALDAGGDFVFVPK